MAAFVGKAIITQTADGGDLDAQSGGIGGVGSGGFLPKVFFVAYMSGNSGFSAVAAARNTVWI